MMGKSGLSMIYRSSWASWWSKNYLKNLTPGRYHVQPNRQPKKRRQCFFFELWFLAGFDPKMSSKEKRQKAVSRVGQFKVVQGYEFLMSHSGQNKGTRDLYEKEIELTDEIKYREKRDEITRKYYTDAVFLQSSKLLYKIWPPKWFFQTTSFISFWSAGI